MVVGSTKFHYDAEATFQSVSENREHFRPISMIKEAETRRRLVENFDPACGKWWRGFERREILISFRNLRPGLSVTNANKRQRNELI